MKLAIISDIHEDIVNLKQTLHKIEKTGCDKIFCLGDISGFSVPHYRYFDTRNAHECLKLVKENCEVVILGNHDLQAARRIPEAHGDFRFPENWYELDYRERKALSQGKVWLYDHDELDPLYTRDDINYLKSLPEKSILEQDSKRILFTHYIIPNISGAYQKFYHTAADYTEHFRYMREQDCAYSFAGHAHSSGLYITNEMRTRQKGFNKKVIPDTPVNVIVPSVAGNQIGHGFCIFDTVEGWVKAVRV